MGALTENTPKVLLEYKNKPLISYSLDALFSAGISDITLATGYRSNQVVEATGNLPSINYDWRYNTFYVLMDLIEAAHKKGKRYIILTDGDTAFGPDVIATYLRHELSVPEFALTWCAGTKTNQPSSWVFDSDKLGVVRSIHLGRANSARIFAIIRVTDLYFCFQRAGLFEKLGKYKLEDQFVPGFEKYFLGWGLLVAQALSLDQSVRFIEKESSIVNLNRPDDLLFNYSK